MTLSLVRSRMVMLMKNTLSDQAAHYDWVYRAVRPMPVPATWKPGQIVYGDCSKGVQYIAHWAGAPDPMGDGYNSYGNSQTIAMHLQHVPYASDLQPGDIITFGSWGSEHAAMVMVAGKNPTLWSFGHQGAPNSYLLSYDPRVHQYLRMPIAYVATTAEKLRAETGWFAWVAWRLGEGDWRHYGPINASVRPNVPKTIPAEWWLRLAQFLKNRKAAN